MNHLSRCGLALLIALVGCSSDPAVDGETADSSTGADTSSIADAGAADTTTPADSEAKDAAATDTIAADTNSSDVATDAGSSDTIGDTAIGDTASADIAAADTANPIQDKVTLPLGETLFLSGDDYLWSWGLTKPGDATFSLDQNPTGSSAKLVVGVAGKSVGRLTPDKVGAYKLCKKTVKSGVQQCVTVQVVDDFLSEDTFQNYNYSPTNPIAVESVAKDGKSFLWVAATTSNRVERVEVGADSVKVTDVVPTGGWPCGLAMDAAGGMLLVAQTGRDSLGFVDIKSRLLVDAIQVGNEPASVIMPAAPTATVAYVAISGEDRIVKVDLTTRTVIGSVAVGHDPRAMAIDDSTGRLFAASLLSSNATPQGPKTPLGPSTLPEWMRRDIAVIDAGIGGPDKGFKLLGFAPEVGTILRGVHFRPDTGELLVGATHANNTVLKVDADTNPHQHKLLVLDPEKAAKSSESAVKKTVDLDKQKSSAGPAASPFSMFMTGHYLAVTLSAGKSLLLLNPKTYAEYGRIETGHDPRGLVLANGRLWTYAWLSNKLQGIPLPGPPDGDKLGTTAALLREVAIGADPTPKAVKDGQIIFNDATFSKHNDFSCNNCHPDGLTDGMVWDLLVDGPVNTLAFRNVGGTGPFLWGGQLPTLFDFSREVLKLVGASATGKQMELLTTYMQSVTAPPNPFTLPGGRLTDDAIAGKQLFDGISGVDGASCSQCHSGPLYTNGKTQLGKTKGEMTDTPSLLGTYDTGPWGREGQWRTLGEMVDYAVEFTEAKLDTKQRAQLLAFVQQLPGNRLYVTSATPLNDSKYVWFETKLEVVFSALLTPAQQGLFLFRRMDGTPKAVAGKWTVSGRYARFVPDAKLAQNARYEIAVGGQLVGQLGEQLGGGVKIGFETGGTPAFDVSGEWEITLEQTLIGKQKAKIAFVQATGGKVTGALLSKFDQGDVENGAVDGHVSGDTLVLHPFYLDSSFGKFFIDKGITAKCEDTSTPKDGFADAGSGSFVFAFGGTPYTVNVTLKRLKLPKQ